MSIRIITLLFLILFLGACGRQTEEQFSEYSPEVFNTKWMAGTVNQASGVFFLVGEQGSIIWSGDGRDWTYADTPVTHRLHDIDIDIQSGVLVAVGDGGTVLRSEDSGRTWGQPTIEVPANANFTSTHLKAVLHYPNGSVWLAAGTRNTILRSSDQGKSWQLVSYNTSASQLEILALFVESKTGDLLLAAQHGTTARSTDGGLSWKVSEHDMQAPGDYIPHIVGFHQYGDVLIAAADLGCLLISENGGENWRLLKLPTEGYFTDSAYDPVHRSIVLTTQMGEIARSQDGGNSWRVETFEVNNWPSDDIPRLSSIVYDEQSRSLLVIGNSGVIARSSDGGKSWQADILKPLFNLSVTTLLHDPRRNVFVTAGQGGFVATTKGLALPRNLQQGWEFVRPGIDQYMRQVLHIPDSDTFIVVGQLGGIWRSEDDGRHWRVIEVDYPRPNQPPHLRDIVFDSGTGALIAAGPPGTIVRSVDGGTNWTAVFQGPLHKGEAFTQILVDKKRRALIACEVLYQSVYRSSDGGVSWEKITTINTNGRRVWHGAISEKLDLILMVGQQGAVSVSRDGGDTWQMVETKTKSDLYGAFVDDNSGALFAVGEKGTILRSEDGDRWQAVDSGTPGTLRGITLEPDTGALLAFGQQGTIMRSTDSGRQWSRALAPVVNSELRKVLLEPGSDNLVAIGRDGVVLRSVDSGKSWQPLTSHTHQHFRSADFNPATGTLIAVGDGLIRLSRQKP